MKSILRTGVLLPALFAATAAFANPALVITDLNLRTGPGAGYRVITAMPNGAVVNVSGCVRGYSWCRVDWNGYDGWAASSYLAQRSERYGRRVYSTYGAEIGIPLIAGAVIGGVIANDHDYYYRPGWHHHRHWRHGRHYRHRLHRERRHLRHVRRRLRHERRHLRRVHRHERRIEHRHHHR